MLRFRTAAEFGQSAVGEPEYRALQEEFVAEDEGNWVVMPMYPYSPTESLFELPGAPPHPPTAEHPFGTDDRGRDVFVRLAYGFNVSLAFALLVTVPGLHVRSDDRRSARVLWRPFGHLRTASHRDLVVAAISLHRHHHQFDRRAGLHLWAESAPSAGVLAARRDPVGVCVDGDHVLRPRGSSIERRPRTTSAQRLPWVRPNLQSCSDTSCQMR